MPTHKPTTVPLAHKKPGPPPGSRNNPKGRPATVEPLSESVRITNRVAVKLINADMTPDEALREYLQLPERRRPFGDAAKTHLHL